MVIRLGSKPLFHSVAVYGDQAGFQAAVPFSGRIYGDQAGFQAAVPFSGRIW